MASMLISVAHFCDKHGPRVLMVTQAGSIGSTGDELLVPNYPTDSYCESCSMYFPGDLHSGVRSMKSNIGNRCYVSTQYSSVRYQLLTLIVRRCFSEETMSYDGSPVVFYDDLRGLNLIIGFKLNDDNARGNERRYCMIFTIDSKDHRNSMRRICENWNFITGGFSRMISYIREAHESEERREEQCSFSLLGGSYLRGNKVKIPRRLSDLTDDKLLFVRIHRWNCFLLDSVLRQ
ncbi:hypothetical protein HG537_0E01190 [Torulaspora globosa]|uniref:UDENN FLCN/SMCR8-type domain-containing protein n=1 Tax=Torulaspora globosa TaxID=48254 RepID=A0A7H9HSQ3_9SACH|nr:hypothetical protein HG537_0E01190 [Torulaspora sp. CBS 2947]